MSRKTLKAKTKVVKSKLIKPVEKIQFAKETAEEKRARTLKIIKQLQQMYPDAHCALNAETPFQLLVATILSAQCTDERVNLVTAVLFQKCSNPKDFVKIKIDDLEHLIRSTGFFKNKAKNIKECAKAIIEEHHGEVPKTLEELTALAGVGRKTANVVLGNSFGIASGVVVDTHVRRLSQRLNLTKNDNPEKIEVDLNALVPEKHWIMFSHWLIFHGRQICKARTPLCERCRFAEGLCPSRLTPYMGSSRM